MVIENCKKAAKPADIKHIEKLSGYTNYYKIKTAPYRFGIYIEKATGFKLGILYNFSERSLYYQRIVKEN